MRSIGVIVLCLASAAVGAGIDRYWDSLSSFWQFWENSPSLTRSNAPEPEQPTAVKGSGAESSKVVRDEVLGDRVRCDVRYQELKIAESEYKSFFDKCMGNTGTAGQSN
jgi:hypothetical protein